MFPWLNKSKVYRYIKKNCPKNITSPSKKKCNKPSTSLLTPLETPTARTIKKLKNYVTPGSLSKTSLGKQCSICKYVPYQLSIDMENTS